MCMYVDVCVSALWRSGPAALGVTHLSHTSATLPLSLLLPADKQRRPTVEFVFYFIFDCCLQTTQCLIFLRWRVCPRRLRSARKASQGDSERSRAHTAQDVMSRPISQSNEQSKHEVIHLTQEVRGSKSIKNLMPNNRPVRAVRRTLCHPSFVPVKCALP